MLFCCKGVESARYGIYIYLFSWVIYLFTLVIYQMCVSIYIICRIIYLSLNYDEKRDLIIGLFLKGEKFTDFSDFNRDTYPTITHILHFVEGALLISFLKVLLTIMYAQLRKKLLSTLYLNVHYLPLALSHQWSEYL